MSNNQNRGDWETIVRKVKKTISLIREEMESDEKKVESNIGIEISFLEENKNLFKETEGENLKVFVEFAENCYRKFVNSSAEEKKIHSHYLEGYEKKEKEIREKIKNLPENYDLGFNLEDTFSKFRETIKKFQASSKFYCRKSFEISRKMYNNDVSIDKNSTINLIESLLKPLKIIKFSFLHLYDDTTNEEQEEDLNRFFSFQVL